MASWSTPQWQAASTTQGPMCFFTKQKTKQNAGSVVKKFGATTKNAFTPYKTPTQVLTANWINIWSHQQEEQSCCPEKVEGSSKKYLTKQLNQTMNKTTYSFITKQWQHTKLDPGCNLVNPFLTLRNGHVSPFMDKLLWSTFKSSGSLWRRLPLKRKEIVVVNQSSMHGMSSGFSTLIEDKGTHVLNCRSDLSPMSLPTSSSGTGTLDFLSKVTKLKGLGKHLRLETLPCCLFRFENNLNQQKQAGQNVKVPRFNEQVAGSPAHSSFLPCIFKASPRKFLSLEMVAEVISGVLNASSTRSTGWAVDVAVPGIDGSTNIDRYCKISSQKSW